VGLERLFEARWLLAGVEGFDGDEGKGPGKAGWVLVLGAAGMAIRSLQHQAPAPTRETRPVFSMPLCICFLFSIGLFQL